MEQLAAALAIWGILSVPLGKSLFLLVLPVAGLVLWGAGRLRKKPPQ